MPLTPEQIAARDRLATLYNGGAYSATANPGGMANGGHRVNFEPSLNDIALLGSGTSTLAVEAAQSATAAAGDRGLAQTAATTAEGHRTAAATSATAAGNSATAAQGHANTASTQAGIATNAATTSTGAATAAQGHASTAATARDDAQAAAIVAGGHAATATTQAGIATTRAGEAAASATAAAGSATQLIGTSTTSNSIGTGSRAFTTQAGKFFAAGTDLLITSDANPTTNVLRGRVTAYSGTNVTVNVTSVSGSGTFSDWTLRVAGAAGTNGNSGWTPSLANVADGARRVQQVVDWTGGTGTKPAVGVYVGPAGFVATAAEATDIRGAAGAGSGDVQSTGTVVDGNLAVFDGSTGDLIKDGGPVPTLASLGAQPVDATLTGLAGLTFAANQYAYATGPDAFTVGTITSFGRSFVAAADAPAGRTALGVAIGTDVQAYDATLAALAAVNFGANQLAYSTGADTFALTALSSFGRSLIDDPDAATARSTLELVKGTAAGNVPVLDGSGKLDTAVLPALAINDVFEAESQAAMLALTAQRGDIAVRSDLNRSFVLATDSPSTLADWKELRTPTDLVLSVAGLTGAITAAALKTALAYTAAEVGALAKAGDSLTGALNLAAAADIASAATTDLSTVNSNRVRVTGTTAITSFGAGTNLFRIVRFAGALTLTHNATSLVLPGGASITTAADDVAFAVSDGSGNWRVLFYQRADGGPAAAAAAASGKQSIWIPAGAMTARTTNGAASGTVETATNRVMLKTLDFDTSTAEFAQFMIRMPKSWNEGTVSFQAVWSHASTSTNFGVAWSLAGLALSDDDAIDAAFGTAIVVTDTGGTTNDLYQSAESAAVTIAGAPAEGDTVVFQVARAPADAADTLAIDARLHGVVLFITTNAGNDA